MENKSAHILATASNLLGFSFLVLTSMKSLRLSQTTIIDNVVAVLIVILAFSCMFSFSSIRAKSPEVSKRHESIADYMFIVSLILIAFISVLAALDYLVINQQ
jgi:heme O synthase-like polyprenyltransferase